MKDIVIIMFKNSSWIFRKTLKNVKSEDLGAQSSEVKNQKLMLKMLMK